MDSSTDFFLRILRNIKEHLFYTMPTMEWEFFFKKFVPCRLSHEKVFEWLVANEFLSNSKNISPLHLHFFLHFLHNLFFLLMNFLRPHHGQRFIQSNYQEMATKRCFCWFIGEIIRYEPWFVKWCVRVVLNFWKILWEFSWCLWTEKCVKLVLL